MREILFRAQTEFGEWIEGGYYSPKKGVCFIAKDNDFAHRILRDVKPETVEEYIGLNDKNGKRIFEGNILKGFQYPYFSDGVHNYFAEIVRFDNSPAFGMVTHKNPQSTVRGISDGNSDFICDFNPNDWEIIGDIHDNPELLER